MMFRVVYLENTFCIGDVTKQAVFYITNEIHVSIGSFKYTIFFLSLFLYSLKSDTTIAVSAIITYYEVCMLNRLISLFTLYIVHRALSERLSRPHSELRSLNAEHLNSPHQ